MEFYQRLKELRLNAGYTQTELGEKLGLSNGAIGLYEQNKRAPTNETLKKMATLFKVPIDYLLGFDDFIMTNETISQKNARFALFNSIMALDDDDQELVLSIIENLKNRNK